LARFEDLDPSEKAPADCVVFSCVGLGRAGVAAFENFAAGEYTSQCPSILVATAGVEQYAKSELFNDHRVKMMMPIKFKLLKHELRRLLKIEVQDSPVSSKKTTSVSSGSSGRDDQDTDVDLD
jgi:hypothetical protein